MMFASTRKFLVRKNLVIATLATLFASFATASWAVVIKDGFGDADRNNDGSITFYDTDVNLSETFNASPEDDALNAKGLIEVTSAEDANDVGIKWSATRGFTSSNTGDPKANLKIINDDVPTGAETSAILHNSGLALGYEAKGTGSSMIGNFGQSVVLGPDVGNIVRVQIDMRYWFESNNPTPAANPGEIRWGIFQDTDNELGQFANEGLDSGNGQASIEWGAEDGSWRDAQPGPEGDKGYWSEINTGPAAAAADSRIKFEYNLKNINGTSNNGRFLEGSGASNDVGAGGDVGTVASPAGDGPGGTIVAPGPHTLTMDIVRLASTIQVATYVDGVELLRDDIKPTDTGASILQPAPESFDYIAFRNSSGDADFVFDNFSIRNLVPEPASGLLLILGSLLTYGRKRRI